MSDRKNIEYANFSDMEYDESYQSDKARLGELIKSDAILFAGDNHKIVDKRGQQQNWI